MPSPLPPETIDNGRAYGVPRSLLTGRTEDWPRYAHKKVETIFQVCLELHKNTQKKGQSHGRETTSDTINDPLLCLQAGA